MNAKPSVSIAGLDLGRPHEFTALAVLERAEVPSSDDPTRTVRHYAVRHLERLPPATPYPEVFTQLAGVFDEAMRAEEWQRLQLIVDLRPDGLVAVAVGYAQIIVLGAEHNEFQCRQYAPLEEMLVAVQDIDRPWLGLRHALQKRQAIHAAILTAQVANRGGQAPIASCP